jgi:hypothetical protein
MLFLKNVMIAFIQFVVGKMGIALSHLDTGVAGQFLGKLEIAGSAQNGCYEIVPEGVGGDPAFGLVAQGLTDTLADNISSGGGRDRFDLFPGAFIMPGKEG